MATLWLKDIVENHHHVFRTVAIGQYPLEMEQCWVDCHVQIHRGKSHGLPAYPETWEKALDDNFEVIKNEIRKGERNVILAALGEYFADGAIMPIMVESCLSGISTQALVTLPFPFEGKRRRNFALQALEKIKRLQIPIIVIDREKFMKLRVQSVIDIFSHSYEEVKRACLALAKRTTYG